MYAAALKQHNHKAFRRLNPARLRVNPPLGKGGSKGVHAFSPECLCINNLNLVDPCCGSGSLLLQGAKILGKENVAQGFFGQEINITTYNLSLLICCTIAKAEEVQIVATYKKHF